MRISPQWPNVFLTPRALIIARSWVLCGLKYQHWPVKQTLSWPEWLSVAYWYIYISEKCNAQKSEILTNIDVYSYRWVNKRATCSAWVICSGCGVITCNTQLSVYLKILGTPEFLEFIQLSHHSFRSVLLSLYKTFICRLHYVPKLQRSVNKADRCRCRFQWPG